MNDYSRCVMHNTFPRDDEPCWQCVTKFENTEQLHTKIKQLENALTNQRLKDAKEWTELKKLLKFAKCPNCDGSGGHPVQVAEDAWIQEQCQWCYEVKQALGE